MVTITRHIFINIFQMECFSAVKFAMVELSNQGANSTVSWSKMLHILDILLHKFQLA